VVRAVMRAPDFAYGTFRTFWEQFRRGDRGGLRLAPRPPARKLLHTHDSLSLAEVIRLVNKFSSNVMARQPAAHTRREKAGRPGTDGERAAGGGGPARGPRPLDPGAS